MSFLINVLFFYTTSISYLILELNGEEENESLLIEENHNDKGKDSREKKKSEIMLISISLETKKVMKEEQLQSLFKKT